MRAVVVVTGASSGIGRACALELDRRGFKVFAGVRQPSDAEMLRQDASEALRTVHIDVTDSTSVSDMARVVTESMQGSTFCGLINNAGTTLPYPAEYLPPEYFRAQLEVNLVGPLRVTQALIPLLRRDRGRVVNVTSVAGKVGVPLMASYAASKHGFEGLSDVMRIELAESGIHVAVVEPGLIATDMGRKAVDRVEDTISALPEDGRVRYEHSLRALAASAASLTGGSPPSVVAAAVVHALTSGHPRTRYPVGKAARRMLLLRALLSDRQFDRIIRRLERLR